MIKVIIIVFVNASIWEEVYVCNLGLSSLITRQPGIYKHFHPLSCWMPLTRTLSTGGINLLLGGEKHSERILSQPQLGWDGEKEEGVRQGNPKVLARFGAL